MPGVQGRCGGLADIGAGLQDGEGSFAEGTQPADTGGGAPCRQPGARSRPEGLKEAQESSLGVGQGHRLRSGGCGQWDISGGQKLEAVVLEGRRAS